MFKSFKIFNLFGVNIELHWSWFIILFAYISFDGMMNILVDIASILLLFLFVLIHEFGHIFAARKYGIKTPKILLNMFGGVALMDEDVEKLSDKKKLWVTIAGPLTNLIMLLIFLPFNYLVFNNFENSILPLNELTPIQTFLYIGLFGNIVLLVFNLLPIYPMDGGRLVRSLLNLMKIKNSLMISNVITQIFCIGLIILGAYNQSFYNNFNRLYVFIYVYDRIKK